jgi:hypothetical protein
VSDWDETHYHGDGCQPPHPDPEQYIVPLCEFGECRDPEHCSMGGACEDAVPSRERRLQELARHAEEHGLYEATLPSVSPYLLHHIGRRLHDLASREDCPYRQDIADAANALLGREPDPGSPWDGRPLPDTALRERIKALADEYARGASWRETPRPGDDGNELVVARTLRTVEADLRSLLSAAPPERDEEARFAELRALERDWDSYGSEPLQPGVEERARAILAALRADPTVCLTSDGGIHLGWADDEVMIEVEPDGRVGALIEDQDLGPAPPEREAAAQAERDRIVTAAQNHRRAAWEAGLGRDVIRHWSATAGWVRRGAPSEPDVRGDAPPEREAPSREEVFAAVRADLGLIDSPTQRSYAELVKAHYPEVTDAISTLIERDWLRVREGGQE